MSPFSACKRMPLTARTHAVLRVSCVLAAMSIVALGSATARSSCGSEFGGYTILGAGIVGWGVTSATIFGFPGIAATADDSLRYWPGVGAASVGGALGLGLGLALSASVADCEIVPWLPSVAGISGALVGTLLWALISRGTSGAGAKSTTDTGEAPLPFTFVVAPTVDGGLYAGAFLTW